MILLNAYVSQLWHCLSLFFLFFWLTISLIIFPNGNSLFYFCTFLRVCPWAFLKVYPLILLKAHPYSFLRVHSWTLLRVCPCTLLRVHLGPILALFSEYIPTLFLGFIPAVLLFHSLGSILGASNTPFFHSPVECFIISSLLLRVYPWCF